MDVGLYRGISALSTAQKRLEAITSNLAGAETPGHKRRGTAVNAFSMGAGGVGAVTTQTNDFSQGGITHTQVPTDLALQGPGFFQVEGENGPLFTRDGEFRVGLTGALTSLRRGTRWDAPPRPFPVPGAIAPRAPAATAARALRRRGTDRWRTRSPGPFAGTG